MIFTNRSPIYCAKKFFSIMSFGLVDYRLSILNLEYLWTYFFSPRFDIYTLYVRKNVRLLIDLRFYTRMLNYWEYIKVCLGSCDWLIKSRIVMFSARNLIFISKSKILISITRNSWFWFKSTHVVLTFLLWKDLNYIKN